MTKGRYQIIEEEITKLEKKKAKVLKRKGKAAQMGDIYENVAFEEARNEVWVLNSLILTLKEELKTLKKPKKS